MRRGPGRHGRIAGPLLAILLLSACQSELYNGVPEQEANEMMALLLHEGLSVTKVRAKDGTDTITVEQSQFAAAVDLLRAHGLPRAKFSSINDVFQPSGLIASPMQEQARYLWALGQELSKTVSQIDGVLTARVQVVLPDNDLMKRAPTPSSASVFIRYDDASQVSGLVPQIKALVANSVQGLTYDKVSVVMVPVPHAAAQDLPAPSPEPVWQNPAVVGSMAAMILLALILGFRKAIGRQLARIRPAVAAEPAE